MRIGWGNYTMSDSGYPQCQKCGGFLAAEEWVIDERVKFEKLKEPYLKCINCGKITSPGIILNLLDPERVPIGDQSKRVIKTEIDPNDCEF
jgi:uncharacterized Zn finger protein